MNLHQQLKVMKELAEQTKDENVQNKAKRAVTRIRREIAEQTLGYKLIP